jgi:hypothetical protein
MQNGRYFAPLGRYLMASRPARRYTARQQPLHKP